MKNMMVNFPHINPASGMIHPHFYNHNGLLHKGIPDKNHSKLIYSSENAELKYINRKHS
jgi:hypothetical protein